MKSKIIAFALALFGVATIGITQLPAQAVVDSKRDCTKYDVIYCGTMSPQEARNKYNQKDHAKIFQSMGISRSDLNGSFENGVVYKDGRVVVNGKTVATGAMTAARHLGGTPVAGTNAGKVPVSKMGSAQTAMVKFDGNGKFLFAIMKPCGNPVTATPPKPPKPQPKPKAECKSLTQEKISDTRRRYEAVASVKNGAKVKSYTFVATKNGQQIDAKTKQASTYTLNASSPGDYTVEATVNTTEGKRTGTQCIQSFTIATPPTPPPTPAQPGVAIEKYVGDNQKYQRVGVDVEYTYSIKVLNTGDVALKNVTVTDTPDQGITLLSVSPQAGTITNNTWDYTLPSLGVGESLSFTFTAKVPEYLAGKIVNTVCVDAPEVPGNPDDCDSAEVDVPPVPGKIEVCELATYKVIIIDEADFDSLKHSTDIDDCQAPEELPETGPVETMLQVIGAMSLVGSGAYYVASRQIM